MKKICLTTLGLYCLLLSGFSQTSNDTTVYTVKPLKLDEVNLVSSYYKQDGEHSAVTGGIGTEKVTDISNSLELKFVGYDDMSRKHTLSLGLGVDHHTSASSAYVSKTGASKTGGSRVYPSVNWDMENKAKGTSMGFGAYYSGEYNYHSFGLDAAFSKKNKSNGEFEGKVTAYFDRVKLIYPSELRPVATVVTTTTSASGVRSGGGYSSSESSIPVSPRNTITGSFSFSQVINKRLQGSLMLDLVEQNGYLGLPFHRVYFNDGTVQVEALPSSRFKLPVGARLNYFLGDRIIIRSYYRFYTDDWGLKSHTVNLEVPVKLSPFVTVSPFYRYYNQTAVKYFAPYAVHNPKDQFYTSNYALSAFSSNFLGMGLKIAPPKGILRSKLSAIEIRYGHYLQTTNLVSDVITVHFKFN